MPADKDFGGQVTGASTGTAKKGQSTSNLAYSAGKLPPSKEAREDGKPSSRPQSGVPPALVTGAPVAEVLPVSTLPPVKLTTKHVFGCSTTAIDGIQSFPSSQGDRDINDRLLYKVGRKLCIYDYETSQQKVIGSELAATTVADVVTKPAKNVLHFSVSKNHRYVCVCESTRLEQNDSCDAQVSIYSLSTLARTRTLINSNSGTANLTPEVSGEYVCSAFCGDNKNLALLLQLDDSDRPDATQIQIWTFDKERIFKTVIIPSRVNKIAAAPSLISVSTSGPQNLKTWYVSSDGTLKASNLIPSSKELVENFLDHCWLPNAGTEHRFIALSETEQEGTFTSGARENRSVTSGTSASSQGSDKLGVQKVAAVPVVKTSKQSLFFFDAIELPVNASGSPIPLELRASVILRLEGMSRANALVPYSKGFFVVGSYGFITMFERTEDRRDPYVEIRRVVLGEFHILSATLVPSEDRMVLLSKNARLIYVPMSDLTAPIDDESIANQTQKLKARDLISGGTHTPVGRDPAIIAAASAFQKSLLVTVGADHTARLWNTVTMQCVLVQDLRADDPAAVSLHPSGLQLLVAYKDKVCHYFILVDKLKLSRDVFVKNCRDIKYSNGGKYFAACASVNVFLYDAVRFTQLMNFQGHMMTVRCLYWSVYDDVLFSAGMDGNVYGWPLHSDKRIDILASSSRSSSILSLCSFLPSPPLYAKVTDDSDAPVVANEDQFVEVDPEREAYLASFAFNRVIISCFDGSIKAASWAFPGLQNSKKALEAPLLSISPYVVKQAKMDISSGSPVEPLVVNITSAVFSIDKKRLLVGTNVGSLRIYSWPIGAKSVYQELFAHGGPVIAISESPSGSSITTVSDDGSIYVFTIERNSREEIDQVVDVNGIIQDGVTEEIGDPSDGYNHDVLQISAEDLEHHMNEVSELQKKLGEIQASFEFQLHSMEASHADTMKRTIDHQDAAMIIEKDRYDALQNVFDSRVRDLLQIIADKDADHVRVHAELENRYEHKLADQYDRYDRLCEEMEQLKQRCEGLVASERREFDKQLNSLKVEAKSKEKRLKGENKRIKDERTSDESAFKEILDQQEDEYEDELKQLITAAESELSNERETIMKLRTLVQTKNTKLDQLKKKLSEISSASKARLSLLQTEKKEKQKLLSTIEHYKHNLMEREAALAEKEKVILELRNTTRTLENFRFVLDNRLQQLFAERGPITTHIEDLENHISTMYEELVGEFDNKNAVISQNDVKDKKLYHASKEISKLRADKQDKEVYIAAFKRELNNIVSANMQGKDLEESLRLLYRKYVRGEVVGDKLTKASDEVLQYTQELVTGTSEVKSGAHLKGRLPLKEHSQSISAPYTAGVANQPTTTGKLGAEQSFVHEVEEELIESAKEADRQKVYVERAAKNTEARLKQVREESSRQIQMRLLENSTLMFECNNLRRDVKILKNNVELLTERNRVLESKQGGASHASAGGSLSGSESILSTSHRSMVSEPPAPIKYTKSKDVDNDQKSDVSSLGGSVRRSAYAAADSLVQHATLPKSLSTPVLQAQAVNARVTGSRGGMLQQSGRLISSGGGQRPVPDDELGSLHGDKMVVNLQNQSQVKVDVKLPSTSQLPVNPKASLHMQPQSQQKSLKPRLGQVSAVDSSMTKRGAHHESLVNTRLQTEVDMLSTQLDMVQREKDMQRMEISRLRNQLLKLVGLGGQGNAKEPILPTLEDYFVSNLATSDNMAHKLMSSTERDNATDQISIDGSSIVSGHMRGSSPTGSPGGGYRTAVINVPTVS